MVKLILLCLLVLLNSCTRNDKPTAKKATPSLTQANSNMPELAKRGKEIFYNEEYGETGLSCANCHADFDDIKFPDGKIRPGHSILGAHKRKEVWYGRIKGRENIQKSAAGAGLCAILYLQIEGAKDPISAIPPDDAKALMAYYEYVSRGDEPEILNAKAIALPWEKNKEEKLRKYALRILTVRGNPDNGKNVYESACAQCHSEDIAIGPPFHKIKASNRHIIEMIRGGSHDPEGFMPFFSLDKLTDQQVADVLAYINKIREK
jgi:mono/diheme cytochrome c family protein